MNTRKKDLNKDRKQKKEVGVEPLLLRDRTHGACEPGNLLLEKKNISSSGW